MNWTRTLVVVGAGRGPTWRFWEERMSDVIARCTYRAVLVATAVTARRAEPAEPNPHRHAQLRRGAPVRAQTL